MVLQKGPAWGPPAGTRHQAPQRSALHGDTQTLSVEHEEPDVARPEHTWRLEEPADDSGYSPGRGPLQQWPAQAHPLGTGQQIGYHGSGGSDITAAGQPMADMSRPSSGGAWQGDGLISLESPDARSAAPQLGARAEGPGSQGSGHLVDVGHSPPGCAMLDGIDLRVYRPGILASSGVRSGSKASCEGYGLGATAHIDDCLAQPEAACSSGMPREGMLAEQAIQAHDSAGSDSLPGQPATHLGRARPVIAGRTATSELSQAHDVSPAAFVHSMAPAARPVPSSGKAPSLSCLEGASLAPMGGSARTGDPMLSSAPGHALGQTPVVSQVAELPQQSSRSGVADNIQDAAQGAAHHSGSDAAALQPKGHSPLEQPGTYGDCLATLQLPLGSPPGLVGSERAAPGKAEVQIDMAEAGSDRAAEGESAGAQAHAAGGSRPQTGADESGSILSQLSAIASIGVDCFLEAASGSLSASPGSDSAGYEHGAHSLRGLLRTSQGSAEGISEDRSHEQAHACHGISLEGRAALGEWSANALHGMAVGPDQHVDNSENTYVPCQPAAAPASADELANPGLAAHPEQTAMQTGHAETAQLAAAPVSTAQEAGAAQQADGGHLSIAAYRPDCSPKAATFNASTHLRTPFRPDTVSLWISFAIR